MIKTLTMATVARAITQLAKVAGVKILAELGKDFIEVQFPSLSLLQDPKVRECTGTLFRALLTPDFRAVRQVGNSYFFYYEEKSENHPSAL